MSGRAFVFAGGGTGGHLFPGLAVAHAVRELLPDAEISFLTTTRPLDQLLLASTDYHQVPQPVQPFTLHPLRFAGFVRAWRASLSLAQERFHVRRPEAVLGLGGYGAGPAIVAARKLGIWTAILNPDAVPGRANRFLASRADVVVLQWDVSKQHFPPHTYCQTLGCPIRADFSHSDSATGRARFQLDATRPVLLVTGASQGARTVNEAMIHVWPGFQKTHPEWQLLHLSGPADEADVRAAYAAARAPAHVIAFTDEMHLALAAADLVISRAGASTLAELTTLGRPSILLPYPYHRDRHQHANAQVLVDAGAAICLEDLRSPTANAEPLRRALESVLSPERRRQMAAAARRLGKPRAAHDVAAWLVG